MALVTLAEILADAEKHEYGVPNFDVFNCEMTYGVLSAAEEKRSPVIYALAADFNAVMPQRAMSSLIISLAKEATVPVCLHLDHAVHEEDIYYAVDCGFTSVMIDTSDRPFDENVSRTRAVVDYCHARGVSVEAELGHVSGLGDLYGDDTDICTDVNEAVKFVRLTGVDALAVGIGTVHGVYKGKPNLNIKRLAEIHEALSIPLVLHGGSGLSDEDFKNTIRNGVRKVNIFTDLTLAAVDCWKDALAAGVPHYFNQSIEVVRAVKAEAEKKLEIFGCCNRV